VFKAGDLVENSWAYEDYCPDGIGVVVRMWGTNFPEANMNVRYDVYWASDKKIMWHYEGELKKCSR
jgi:coproporphyrinogen III oxidase